LAILKTVVELKRKLANWEENKDEKILTDFFSSSARDGERYSIKEVGKEKKEKGEVLSLCI
jgi:hypothetical protein